MRKRYSVFVTVFHISGMTEIITETSASLKSELEPREAEDFIKDYYYIFTSGLTIFMGLQIFT